MAGILCGVYMRQIVKARTIAGVICITIPKALASAAKIESGDRLMIELRDGVLYVLKEEETQGVDRS